MNTPHEVEHPLWQSFRQDLDEASSAQEVSEVRDKYLGRQRGLISLELRNLGRLSAEERPHAGQLLNQLRSAVEATLKQHLDLLAAREAAARLSADAADVTLPSCRLPTGRVHPLRRVQKEMEDILVRMGFQIVSGPEIESEYYCFEALNIPKGHPARDPQDTFFVDEELVLRTHTSPVQIRTMERMKPPLRIAVPGRVFRRDAVDATHSPMFHQMEGLVVDEGIRFGDLKGSLEAFFKALFSEETRIRLRPSYFPFVEPGAEVDISCIFCSGKGCRVCKRSGWIEILGAGMVHPHVFEMVGYDPQKYTGFAWGMGIDRIALLKYQVSDLRLFFENDIRFLSQF